MAKFAKPLALAATAIPIIAFVAAMTAQAASPDKAPAVKFGRWLKGTPIKELKHGQWYVLDFWGTQCHPCIEAIPHITSLAKQFRSKVAFIGVGLTQWDDKTPYPGAKPADQDKFMKAHGAQMGYDVVMDSADGYMVAHWMLARHHDSIPTTFVVNPAGAIAWEGDPEALGPALHRLTHI